MLSAIQVLQNVQLVCFAIVFACMVAQSPRDRGLRMLLYNYLAGAVGTLSRLAWFHLPGWLVTIVFLEVAQIRYAFLHLAVVFFVTLGERTRWIGMWIALGCLPFYLIEGVAGHALWEYTLLAAGLAVQTAWTASLLLRSKERMTRWPRAVMGLFFLLYSVMEIARVGVAVATRHDPSQSAPGLERISIYLFVVASSLTPLAFVWMFHSRLMGDLKRQSVMDPLTGLLNRRGFEDQWRFVCDNYRLTGRSFALAIADIDHFKRINDTYGHADGDMVLCGVAHMLRNTVRERDLTGRLGGEEFVFILRDVAEAQAVELVERIRVSLEEHSFRLGEGGVHVSASFGLTLIGGRSEPSLMTLLKEADSAMYEAKTAGRNRVRLYERGRVPSQPQADARAQAMRRKGNAAASTISPL
jgi:diguanylate cyclase (GGDEF)-like protein